ncbi:DUF434 domain-containing protein [Thermosulfuriphilus sp.]
MPRSDSKNKELLFPPETLLRRLKKPAQDLQWLLSRGYPKTTSLTFVGNHYQLHAKERAILFRSIFPKKECLEAQEKRLQARDLEGDSLGLDTFNVLITLENALSGQLLIRGRDGFVRDVAGVFRSWRQSETTRLALEHIFLFLKRYRPVSVVFVLDAPFSGSGELAALIRKNLEISGLEGRAVLEKQVESWLADFSGIVATSDSRLIKRASRVFDLAGHISRFVLKSKILSL